ncbi:MAG: amidohydrolase family protein [Dehalococcoidia bacterium]
MLIDVHVHVFPKNIAPKIAAVSAEMGVEVGTTIDADGYLELLDEGLIDVGLVNEHVANPRLVRTANDYVATLVARMPGRLYGMAVVGRPDEGSATELTRCVRELNFVGLKFQGAVVETAPTDPDAMRLWETALDLQIPVLAHGGPHQEEMYRHILPNTLFEREHAAPNEWLPVVREFPDLKLILAHLGGAAWYRDDIFALLAESPNVYLDTSLWRLGMRSDELVTFIGEVGADRILFGTDYPGSDARKDVACFADLPLPAEDRDKIASCNAARLFGLELERESR